MTARIHTLDALEILDSRGRPTLQVTVRLDSGVTARAGVPSGASTGTREAVERRDRDPQRYAGNGVQQAAAMVEHDIADAVRGMLVGDLEQLSRIDAAMRSLDGTPTLARLGANAVVGVSMAATRAAAVEAGVPLWLFLSQSAAASTATGDLAPPRWPPRMPVPHFNVVNGGVHAANKLDFQEFMIAPIGAPTYTEALHAGAKVYAALRRRLTNAGLSTGLGDEGGFAPAVTEPEAVLAMLVGAIHDAGFHLGADGVAIALDPAASEFYRGGSYQVGADSLTAAQLIDRYETIVQHYPVWSIEDGLAESDFDGWVEMTARLGERVQIVGDDIFVTDPAAISRGIELAAASAALIKANQVGTVSETLEAIRRCREGGWSAMISHRSGETVDDFIADLAVGSGCGQIKAGAPARGERVAKYNRLLEIDARADLPYGRVNVARA